MQFKCAIAMLAAVATCSSTVIKPRAGSGVDVDQILGQMEAVYENPAYADKFASMALAYASSALPTGVDPTKENLYSALMNSDNRVGPSMVADAVSSMDAMLDKITINAEAAEAVSQAMSALHNSSVMTRLSNMMNKLLDNVASAYKEGELGEPTGPVEQDGASSKSDKVPSSLSKGDKSDSANEDSESADNDSDTSAASTTAAGAMLLSVGALAVTAALF
ncbi:hypothetical protein LPJ63_004289 [Coemansia sp. RSA 2711]|nr:hypothetical protein LPJ63_004289 [Coemansia sp. RSA 2711]KAJ2315371.1 hypothetical protein IWW54_000330 [Coemansia sp. RSA 2705]